MFPCFRLRAILRIRHARAWVYTFASNADADGKGWGSKQLLDLEAGSLLT
jgi:hypothetical protein